MRDRFFENTKRALKFLRNSWITVWLVTVVVLLGVGTSYAAYTGVKTSKRVISLSDRDNMLFSSRYMFVGGTDVQKIGFSDSTSDPTITVNVCNYDKSGLGKYSSDIHFQLSARIINYDGSEISTAATNSNFKIALLDDNDDELSLYCLNSLSNVFQTVPGPTYGDISNVFTLSGGTKNQFRFALHFDPDELTTSQYAVEIQAEPVPVGSYDDIKKISGKVGAVSRNSQNLEWSGEFTDKIVNSNPSFVDAYNYVISGAGKGTITLTYDNTVLELDKNDLVVFSGLADYSNDSTTTNGKTVITFHVDTTVENAVSRYAIHFYQKNGTPIASYSDTFVSTVFTPS